jgi:phenylacetate-CoA ligase
MIRSWRLPPLLASTRLLRPVTYRELALLRRIERAPAMVIHSLHEERLAALLRHAYEATDYYREVLGDCCVVREGGLVDLGRFEEIPPLTKDIVRTQGPRLRARYLPKGRKAYLNRTGGSSGQPLKFWQDNYYWDINVATKLYHFEVLGKRLGEPELKLSGSDHDVNSETGTRQAKLERFLYNRRIMTCGRLGERDIEAILDEVETFRPKAIWGYIDALHTIAEHVNRTGRRLRHRPVAVLGGAGTLFPQMVPVIEQAFGVPPTNFYGSREMGDVACECTKSAGLHISMNSHRVEVLDARGHSVVGEDGDLVLTSLHNYAMPFIRYQIGDRGRLTDRACGCGRGFPLIESVSGRSMEAFVRADGAVVSPVFIVAQIGYLTEPELIRRVQYIQEDYERVLVKLVAAPDVSEEELRTYRRRVRAKLREIMGETCEVLFERVSEIPPASSGKYFYTLSKVWSRAGTRRMAEDVPEDRRVA